ncbi:MAG: hypothetical protein ACHQF3_00065 [Alphaproteobacteria bacterium]
MSAEVIPFRPQQTRGAPPPHPYDFWYCLLARMSPARRQSVIAEARRCGVIDARDAEIFLTSWPEREEGLHG